MWPGGADDQDPHYAASAVALLTCPTLAQLPEQAAAKGQVVNEQLPDQWLASKFIGTDVVGVDKVKIGDVNDVLFDHNGKVIAYVIGIGGFLGIGTKDVALTPESFDVQTGSDGVSMRLRLITTKDELKTMAEFKRYNPPATMGQQRDPRN
jgi:hypothetical protein